MKIVMTEIYENARELRDNTPSVDSKIEIKNTDKVISGILSKVSLLIANSDKPCGNTYSLYLTPEEHLVLFNWLKNTCRLGELVTYDLWYHNKNYYRI